MSCSCVYVDLKGERDIPLYRKTEEPIAESKHVCCECKEIIEVGEKYRKEKIGWGGAFSEISFRTCVNCVSIRDTFFCRGWYYKRMFKYLEEHIHNMNGEISEDYIAKLIPEARDNVCEMIEDCWNRQ